MIDWSLCLQGEIELILAIGKRAVGLLGGKANTFTMDIQACHTHGCCLRLADLLEAGESDFLHDIVGIHQRVDRDTGKLSDCFLPRYAAQVVTKIGLGARVSVRHDGFGSRGTVSGIVPTVFKAGRRPVRYWDVTLDHCRQNGEKRTCRKRTADMELLKS